MAAYFRSSVGDFLNSNSDQILGELGLRAAASHASLLASTQMSWERTITALRAALSPIVVREPSARSWGLLLEYEIPRRDRRIDVVLLVGDIVAVLEFKTGEGVGTTAARRQVEHYALDLRDFHRESRDKIIAPIVTTSRGPSFTPTEQSGDGDLVQPVLIANDATLAQAIEFAIARFPHHSESQFNLGAWDRSAYEPVPTIIEAAQMVFAGQNLRELSHAHCDNLGKTADTLIDAVARAQRERRKIICFVTGVPGAGKTLAGLRVIHSSELMRDERPAGMFLSGNRPLVRVISEALARNYRDRSGARIEKARREVGTLVHGVHSFLTEYRTSTKVPPEHVVVFDEAQRAWNASQSLKKAKERALAAERDFLVNVPSEPALMLSILDRWSDWAVLIALVGGGQEIHDGEAGLAEWGRVQLGQFRHWEVWASPEALNGGPSVAGHRLYGDASENASGVKLRDELHLAVSNRSYRASAVTNWVNAVIGGQADEAKRVSSEISQFPITLTRSLDRARDWLRHSTRGLRRCGLLASSGALRLRPNGIEVSSGFRGGISFEEWFLAPPDDVRSSNTLEVAATEFECQGLELDWTGLCWGDDFTWRDGQWNFRRFAGSSWKQIQKAETQDFARNKYRVLLTRAREGTVIWVPRGDKDDLTRDPGRLDSTADFLLSCGATTLDE